VDDIAAKLPPDSWFQDWLKCFPTAEAPKSYILLTAMAFTGAALGRRCYMDQDVHKIYPMLNLLLIGPSGIGKSTSLGLGRQMLEQLDLPTRPQLIIGAPTPEKLHEDLVANPHAILIASELAAFFSKQRYMEALVPMVTELLDYRPIERRTRMRGIVRVEEPAVTVVGGSTQEWLQEQLPDSATTGGFLARFLIINELHRSQRVPLPGTAMGRGLRKEIDQLRMTTLGNFKHLIEGAPAVVGFRSYSDSDTFSLWYANHKPPTGHLAPFAARSREFVLRLSLLVALSRLHTSIEAADIDAAVTIYSYCEARLQEVVVPMSQQGKLLMAVLQAVERPMFPSEVKRAMHNIAMSTMVQQCIDSLLETKDLTRLPDGRLKRGQ